MVKLGRHVTGCLANFGTKEEGKSPEVGNPGWWNIIPFGQMQFHLGGHVFWHSRIIFRGEYVSANFVGVQKALGKGFSTLLFHQKDCVAVPNKHRRRSKEINAWAVFKHFPKTNPMHSTKRRWTVYTSKISSKTRSFSWKFVLFNHAIPPGGSRWLGGGFRSQECWIVPEGAKEELVPGVQISIESQRITRVVIEKNDVLFGPWGGQLFVKNAVDST